MRGQKLAIWGSQPGLELSTETPATGKGARPRRSLATDATGRQPFPREEARSRCKLFQQFVTSGASR